MVKAARRRPDMCNWDEVSLAIVDDAGIAAVHTAFMGDDSPTDVMTFALDPVPGGHAGCAGEIIVNIQRAATSYRKGWDAERELALYIAHGCDHLTGATDATPEDRQRMRRRELRWLRDAVRTGLVAGILPGTASHASSNT